MAKKEATSGKKPLWVVIVLSVITFGLYPLLRKSEKKKSTLREWTDAILFAVIAATIIRTFFIEAFTIPTPSMEKSLLVGDFLFVSKVSYGARVPMTPISFPFAHHTMPFTESTKAYSELIKLPYYRLPGLGEVKHGDCVVFNYPMEDFRPTDKKENYIKRCVGLPGDTLQVKQAQLFINSNAAKNPTNSQLAYIVKTNDGYFNPDVLRKMNINECYAISNQGDFMMFLTNENAEIIKTFSNVTSVVPDIKKEHEGNVDIFPNIAASDWNVDNFGPLYIPKAGTVVQLNMGNIPLWKRLIVMYENNTCEVKDSTIFINGKATTSYTFKKDYYFMMGDNRHNSADSRFWGFVPMDHIVGKAVFIWLSLDANETNIFKKIRFSRMFTFVQGYNISNSYFIYFMILMGGIYGFNYYRKKKGAKPAKK